VIDGVWVKFLKLFHQLRTAFEKAFANRWRGTKQIQNQQALTLKVSDQAKISVGDKILER